MILVTLGTQKQQFKRLLEAVENLSVSEEIIVQSGETVFESDHLIIHSFISMEEMEKFVDEARIIITHGGTGSIISALKKKKKVIACARKKEFDEHLDNHQDEIVKTFSNNGYILSCDDMSKLQNLVDNINTFEPKIFKSQSEQFMRKLEDRIDSF